MRCAGDIKKLKEAGFHTIQALLMSTSKVLWLFWAANAPSAELSACHDQRLAETKGLSEAKVAKVLEAAKKMCSGYGWLTATQVSRWGPGGWPEHATPGAARRARRWTCRGSARSSRSAQGPARWTSCSRAGLRPRHAAAGLSMGNGSVPCSVLRLCCPAGHHRDVWGVPDRQDPDLPHTVRHHTAAASNGRGCWQGRCLRCHPPAA